MILKHIFELFSSKLYSVVLAEAYLQRFFSNHHAVFWIFFVFSLICSEELIKKGSLSNNLAVSSISFGAVKLSTAELRQLSSGRKRGRRVPEPEGHSPERVRLSCASEAAAC